MAHRSDQLAARLEAGASALAQFAVSLNAEEWRLRLPHDGRTVGVVVHHVARMYPLEIQLAQSLAAGNAITGLTWNDVHKVNAQHAKEFEAVDTATAIAALQAASRHAAAAVRALSDAELDTAAPVSLNADAPLTCQFFVEDHALRHSYHHLAGIRATVEAWRAGSAHAASGRSSTIKAGIP